MRRWIAALAALALAAGGQLAGGEDAGAGLGLAVAAEHRCAPYDRRDYRYSQGVEDAIVRQLGGLYSPYDGEAFASKRESQIEHMVAIAEAHDSGLCAAPAPVKRQFAGDLLNLTLASPQLNRAKGAKDAADWLPARNRCWFASRVVAVKAKYGLSVDRREAAALARVLTACAASDRLLSARQ